MAGPNVFAFPMSTAQLRLWLLHRLTPESAAYNISSAVTLHGTLDVDALQRSLDAIVSRHETLRTYFAEVEGEPSQLIREEARLPLQVRDLRHLPEAERGAAVRRYAAAEAARAFDLSTLPLIRVSLLRTADESHVLVSVMHHIISDGWSMGVFARELGAHYGAAVRGDEASLPDLPVQYADFAEWQRESLEQTLPRLTGFWRGELDGLPQLLELPSDRPRPAVATFRGGSIPFTVATEVTDALRGLARQENASLFMALLAAVGVLLSRQSGETDLCIGTPVSGRDRSEVEPLIGFFVNMLPMRMDLSGHPTFRELLQRVRTRALAAFAHQEMPFDRLVAELQPQRNLGATPFFQVLFVLQNTPAEDVVLPGLTIAPYEIPRESTQFDLSVSMQETRSGIDAALEYNSDLFDRASAERLVRQLQLLLSAIAANADARVAALPLLSAPERETIVETWNATARPYDLDTTLSAQLAAQAARTPDAIAVVAEDGALTYAALDRDAARLAAALGARGVTPGGVVGVYAERSLELMVALCAIVKAGCAYVPLDPAYPAERLAYMVETAGARVVLTQARLAADVAAWGATALGLDGPDAADWRATPPLAVPAPIHPDDLAYVLYTSGSTGRPKGVMVSHRAIVNRLHWMQEAYRLTASDVVLQKTPASFDVSVWEFFWPLLTGATLVMARPGGHRDPAYLTRVIQAEGVTVLHFVPSMLAAFVEEPSVRACTSLRDVICSGEALPRPLCDRFFARSSAALHNLYGPTEAAVDVTAWACERDGQGPVPIGLPIANIRMHVLDGDGQPCPVGVAGELMIGGVGLARGYVGRPALTADRFVPDPLGVAADARLYRTGDRARYRADGALEYLGRLDFQVKLRGQRIELGEIESTLASHPAVRSAAVVLAGHTADDQRLVGYIAGDPGAGEPPADEELRRHLAQTLPEYMVPAVFVRVDELPLTPTGKLDRRALPVPDLRVSAAATLPRTGTEAVVAAVWTEVLGLEHVDVHANFFEIGGHSLRANQVVSRLRAHHRIDLPLQAMFEQPTIAALAARIDRDRGTAGAADTPLAARPRPPRIPLSYSQERLWFLNQSQGPNAAYNLFSAFRLTGDLDREALSAALAALVSRHEILRTTFSESDGVPFQVIHPAAAVDVPVVDLTGLAREQQSEETRRRASAEALAAFDLERGPLFRISLLRLGEREHVLLSAMHHIIFDGWSNAVLARQLTAIYDARRRGVPLPEEAERAQYADYAIWQREALTDDVVAGELDYWRAQLADLPDALALPADFPRRDAAAPAGAIRDFRIETGFEPALKQLCATTGATPFMVYLAAYAALLGRYAGQDDLVIGSGIANREHRETEDMLGFFVNTLALRVDLRGNPSFRELVTRVRDTALGAFHNARTPFHKVVEALGAGQGESFYQAIFVLQNTPADALELGPLRFEPLPIESAVAKTDLVLEFTEGAAGVAGRVEYNADLFAASTVARMMSHLRMFFREALARPDRWIGDLPLLADGERNAMLALLSGERSPYPAARSVHQLFEEQAVATPDAVAAVFGDAALTYRELNARANRLAHYLLARGVTAGSLVGVFAERSLELVIGLLGILKAGAGYVSFELGSPEDRLAFMMADAGVRVAVTQIDLIERIPRAANVEPVVLDDPRAPWLHSSAANPAVPTWPDALAYVSYTSGSTGRPKGVEVTHRGVVRLVRNTGYVSFGAGETMLLFAPVSFDASTFEIWGALLNGATLVIGPPGAAALDTLGDVIRTHGVTTMWMTAGLFHVMADEHLEDLGSVRQLVAGGDVVSPAHARAVLNRHHRLTLINGYGPTEGTTFTCCHRMSTAAEIGARVPIGKPIANTTVCIADAAMQLAPLGVHGELLIGGAGLARGYLRRPGLTAERFVPDGWGRESGARLYRSGDRVSLSPDGTVQFLERIDDQVKIRGFRVDLGEIETHLRGCPTVQEAVVVARSDAGGQKQLIAYVTPVPGGKPATAADLRQHLRERVPAYMVPSAFVWMDEFPLTANGKLDRRALPQPETAEVESEYMPPRTATEQIVAAIWAEVLGGVRVGVHDDFFELGGHSLLATQVMSRLRRRFSGDLPLQMLFEFSTVGALATAIEGVAAIEVAAAGEAREEFEI